MGDYLKIGFSADLMPRNSKEKAALETIFSGTGFQMPEREDLPEHQLFDDLNFSFLFRTDSSYHSGSPCQGMRRDGGCWKCSGFGQVKTTRPTLDLFLDWVAHLVHQDDPFLGFCLRESAVIPELFIRNGPEILTVSAEKVEACINDEGFLKIGGLIHD